jgi:hypothetical protein
MFNLYAKSYSRSQGGSYCLEKIGHSENPVFLTLTREASDLLQLIAT